MRAEDGGASTVLRLHQLKKLGRLTAAAYETAAADVRRRYDQCVLEQSADAARAGQAPPVLGDRQRAIVEALQTDGIAVVSFEHLFEAGVWSALLVDTAPFIAGSHRDIAYRSRYGARIRHMVRRLVCRVMLQPGPKGVRTYRRIGDGALVHAADPLIRIGVSASVLDIANAYLGFWSKLSYADTWVTSPYGAKARRTKSTLWHRDFNDRRMLKVFLYMSDVDANSGMFEYVPGSMRSANGEGDDDWEPAADSRLPGGRQAALDRDRANVDVRSIVGSPGTLIFCDTSGLHRGGFVTRGSRAVSTWTYVSTASLSCIAPRSFRVDEAALPSGTPAAARFALT